MEKSVKPKRSIAIKVRVTPDELVALRDRSRGGELARWIRETCLAIEKIEVLPVPLPPAVEPELLRQLAGIGNLTNQIARAIHGKGIDPASRISALGSLVQIEAELVSIRRMYTR